MKKQIHKIFSMCMYPVIFLQDFIYHIGIVLDCYKGLHNSFYGGKSMICGLKLKHIGQQNYTTYEDLKESESEVK